MSLVKAWPAYTWIEPRPYLTSDSESGGTESPQPVRGTAQAKVFDFAVANLARLIYTTPLIDGRSIAN